MDAEEFLNRVVPAAKHSRLTPYWDQILLLRARNCTLKQVCDFLGENGVHITIAGLSKYITRREAKRGKDSTQKLDKKGTAADQTTHDNTTRTSVQQARMATQEGMAKSSNPLRALSTGTMTPGEFHAIPPSKIEFD